MSKHLKLSVDNIMFTQQVLFRKIFLKTFQYPISKNAHKQLDVFLEIHLVWTVSVKFSL